MRAQAALGPDRHSRKRAFANPYCLPHFRGDEAVAVESGPFGKVILSGRTRPAILVG